MLAWNVGKKHQRFVYFLQTQCKAGWMEMGSIPGRVIPKTGKTVLAACVQPLWLMLGISEKLHERCWHWLTTSAAFTANLAAWPTAQVSGNGGRRPLVTGQREQSEYNETDPEQHNVSTLHVGPDCGRPSGPAFRTVLLLDRKWALTGHKMSFRNKELLCRSHRSEARMVQSRGLRATFTFLIYMKFISTITCYICFSRNLSQIAGIIVPDIIGVVIFRIVSVSKAQLLLQILFQQVGYSPWNPHDQLFGNNGLSNMSVDNNVPRRCRH